MNLTIKLSLFLCAASFLTNCGVEPAKVVAPETELLDEPVIIIELESEEFEFIPPSPLEVAQVFKSAGLTFNKDALNPTSNAINYTSKFKKTTNFGIYSADLACCVVNDKINDAQEYLEIIKTLGDDIGLGSVFKEELIAKFKANINDKDSIADVLTEVQVNTNNYIEENRAADLQATYFAGAWLEAMYLGALTSKEGKKSNVVKKISLQIELGSKIAKGLDKVSQTDPDVADMKQNILDIVYAYQNLESVKNMSEEDIEFNSVNITDEEMKTISGLIFELRRNLIAY